MNRRDLFREGARFSRLLAAGVVTRAFAASDKPVLMAVFSHPDDETTVGALLAKYAAEGHDVYLVSITSGQKGKTPFTDIPMGDELGAAREAELRCAASKLGIHPPILLGYQDQGISDPRTLAQVGAKLRGKINELTPDVIITWGAEGVTGHPDHRATHNIASEVFQQRSLLKHKPRKLYYVAFPESRFSNLKIEGRRLPFRLVSDAFITTEVDCAKYEDQAWAAIQCHKTQWDAARMAEHRQIFEEVTGRHAFLRLALSDRPGKANTESDIFENLK